MSNEILDKHPLIIKQNWDLKITTYEDNILDNLDEIYEYFHDNLGMKGENNEIDRLNPKWEVFHFILQLVRIPKNNQPYLKKLLQIAYNVGQSSESREHYSENCMRVIINNEMDNLNTYLKDIKSPESIDLLYQESITIYNEFTSSNK